MGRLYIFTEWKILEVKIMHADLFFQLLNLKNPFCFI